MREESEKMSDYCREYRYKRRHWYLALKSHEIDDVKHTSTACTHVKKTPKKATERGDEGYMITPKNITWRTLRI
jgi:hypothetical protein